MPTPHLATVLLSEALHKYLQVGEDSFLADPRQLHSVFKFEKQMKQF
jgi:hypothetical protein